MMSRADAICRKGYLLPHCPEGEQDQQVRLYWDPIGKTWSVSVAGSFVSDTVADELIDAAVNKYAIARTPEDS